MYFRIFSFSDGYDIGKPSASKLGFFLLFICLNCMNFENKLVWQIIVWKVVPRNHASLRSPGKDHVDLISSFDTGFQFYSQQYQAVHIGRLIGHEGSIFRIACSSDGSMLISVSDDCRCAS